MPKRILIVEDMETNREIVARLLMFHGYEVLYAENGQEAIDTALSAHPDLILMDMGLPIMDGWEATKQIRQLDAIKNIPIIALTAHAMSSDKRIALEAGCTDYESKPINFESLIKKIENATQI